MENSMDPDHMASLEASWFESTMFSKIIKPGSAGQGWYSTLVSAVRTH